MGAICCAPFYDFLWRSFFSFFFLPPSYLSSFLLSFSFSFLFFFHTGLEIVIFSPPPPFQDLDSCSLKWPLTFTFLSFSFTFSLPGWWLLGKSSIVPLFPPGLLYGSGSQPLPACVPLQNPADTGEAGDVLFSVPTNQRE